VDLEGLHCVREAFLGVSIKHINLPRLKYRTGHEIILDEMFSWGVKHAVIPFFTAEWHILFIYITLGI
jgi:hypothetical protein